MPNFIYPSLSVNLSPETAVIIRLTDSDDVTYDWRVVASDDVPMFNAIVQDDTDGELWWEIFDDLSADSPMRCVMEWDVAGREIEFDDADTARQFKQRHPRWRVLLTTVTTTEVTL